LPRPNLLGAILVKTRAIAVDDAKDSQRIDVAFLLTLVEDLQGDCVDDHLPGEKVAKGAPRNERS
jgi:hypothetical protein